MLAESPARVSSPPLASSSSSGGQGEGLEFKDNRHVSLPLIEQLPRTMKAAVYKLYGDPWSSLLTVNPEFPTPQLSRNNEVLVRVHAASVNPSDLKVMRGDYQNLAKKLPFVPGFDVSGVVVQVGLDCKRIKKGDEVYGFADFRRCGTLAEYVLMQEREVSYKPRNLTHTEAAALPMCATAAYKALVSSAMVEKGQKVLILGGSGGVGSLAIQLAKGLGAHVACTTSTANVELCQQLGADFVVDYTQTRWYEILKGERFSCILDTVGGAESWQQAQVVLDHRGAFVTVAGDRQGKVTLKKLLSSGVSIVNRKFWSLFGNSYYDYIVASPNFQILSAVRDIVEGRAVKPVIDRIYSLDQTQAAVQHVRAGHARGKVIVSMVADERPPKQLYLRDAQPVDYSVRPEEDIRAAEEQAAFAAAEALNGNGSPDHGSPPTSGNPFGTSAASVDQAENHGADWPDR